MMRAALFVALLSCSMASCSTTDERAAEANSPANPPDSRVTEAQSRRNSALELKKSERMGDETKAKTAPAAPPKQCEKETEDSRKELLDKLDCLLREPE